MGKSDDLIERVMDDADALRETAMEGVRSDLGTVLQAVVRVTRARPVTALMAAGLIGFLVAYITSK